MFLKPLSQTGCNDKQIELGDIYRKLDQANGHLYNKSSTDDRKISAGMLLTFSKTLSEP